MKNFHEIAPAELENVCRLFGENWALITVADGDKVNAMTASWGGVGILWHKPVAFIFVRPQRHTFTLVEKESTLSLCFLDEEWRDALRLCGTKSGRDTDKLAEAGLTANHENGTPFVDESRLVILCRKLYAGDLEEACFLDPAEFSHYKNKDFHRMYICEIEKVLLRD